MKEQLLHLRRLATDTDLLIRVVPYVESPIAFDFRLLRHLETQQWTFATEGILNFYERWRDLQPLQAGFAYWATASANALDLASSVAYLEQRITQLDVEVDVDGLCPIVLP